MTPRTASLAELFADTPEELRRQALSHSSWVETRTEAYGRLAFLGDSVLGLSVATELFDEHPDADIGELTKILNQAVSGRACAEVARELGLPEMLARARAEATARGLPVETLLASERTLASVCEAVIGACYLAHGFERQLRGRGGGLHRARSSRRRGSASTSSPSSRSGSHATATTVSYEVTDEAGPPHDRRFEVRATVDGDEIGSGLGAKQEGGRAGRRASGRWRTCGGDAERIASGYAASLQVVCDPCDQMYLKAINLKGFKSFPDRTRLTFCAGRQRDRRPERLRQVEHHRRGALGARRAEPHRRPRPVDARRDLRRRQGPVAAPLRRGRGGDRQLRGPRRQRVLRDLDHAADRAQRRRRVQAERRPLSPRRHRRGALRHEHGPRDALGDQPGPGRGDRQLEAPGPAPADRGGRRARQAPQAPPPRPAQARAHPRQPRAGARRRTGGPLTRCGR